MKRNAWWPCWINGWPVAEQPSKHWLMLFEGSDRPTHELYLHCITTQCLFVIAVLPHIGGLPYLFNKNVHGTNTIKYLLSLLYIIARYACLSMVNKKIRFGSVNCEAVGSEVVLPYPIITVCGDRVGGLLHECRLVLNTLLQVTWAKNFFRVNVSSRKRARLPPSPPPPLPIPSSQRTVSRVHDLFPGCGSPPTSDEATSRDVLFPRSPFENHSNGTTNVEKHFASI